jgi:ubiquinone/menaquinone biosynthesis C-methylase UbiE
MTLAEQLQLMQRDWDERARENARHFVNTSRTDWTDQDFFASGELAVAGDILTDTVNIYQGMDPARMRVLEIGCGAGRLTRALSKIFGEVHAVDVSGEMVARARAALCDRPNVKLYQNNGCDLAVVPPLVFEFAYSSHVFQHIPSREVIETYVREVHRLLRPGALFKFQVQGELSEDRPDDTWHGASYDQQQATAMAQRCGFEFRHSFGEGHQYFWLWFFKPPA